MKPLLCLVAAALLVGALSVYALPARQGAAISATRAFSLNGKWYSVGKPAESESLLRKELSKRGIDMPRSSRGPGEPAGCTVVALSEIPSKNRFRPPPLPPGFRVETSVQMESGDGWIEIAHGSIPSGKDYARKALSAAGWKFIDTEKSGRTFFLATLHKERENSIVFLEEKEGNCLLVRKREK